MSKLTTKLENKKIKSVQSIEDYIQIFFEDGAILCLYNRCMFSDSDFSKYQGKIVNRVKVNEDFIMNLDKLTIIMSLRDADYIGPEAIFLSDGEDLIVF